MRQENKTTKNFEISSKLKGYHNQHDAEIKFYHWTLSHRPIIPAWSSIKYVVGQIPINPPLTNLTEETIIGDVHKYKRFQIALKVKLGHFTYQRY
jgi:hypothetical protein